MQPAFATGRQRAFELVTWIVSSVVHVLLAHAILGASWTGATAFGAPLGLLAVPMSLSAWYLCRVTPLARAGAARVLLTAAVAALAAGGIWAAIGAAWWSALGRAGYALTARGPELSALLVGIGALSYLLAVAVYYARDAVEESTAAERRALELEIAERDAELRALRAKIDPHFLFNSLNSIAGFLSVDPAKARVMCQLLADFLRETVRLSAAGRIPIAQEVALAEHYLRVEEMRFGSRLRVRTEVDPSAAEVSVPPLLLQPLVENAVRHGIATRLDGGTIDIRVDRAGPLVRLAVSNPRDPDGSRRGTGVGQDLVRRRLLATYGNDASLAVEAGPESYRAAITLPAREQS